MAASMAGSYADVVSSAIGGGSQALDELGVVESLLSSPHPPRIRTNVMTQVLAGLLETEYAGGLTAIRPTGTHGLRQRCADGARARAGYQPRI